MKYRINVACAIILLCGLAVWILGGGLRRVPRHHSPPAEGGTFDFVLLRQMAGEAPDSNLCVSPFSLQTALSMVYNGAAGNTRRSLAKTLVIGDPAPKRLNDTYAALVEKLLPSGGEVKLNIANSLWASKNLTLKSGFIQACRNSYRAHLYKVDFGSQAAPIAIGKWIEKNTGGQIRSIGPELKLGAAVVVVNTLRFSALWTQQFDRHRTTQGTFITSSGAMVTAPMMHTMTACLACRGKGFLATAISYRDDRMTHMFGRYAMYVFLPDAELGIDGFLDSLNDKNWHKWMSEFKPGEILLTLPRFTVQSGGDNRVQSSLAAMGLEGIFHPGADFTQLCDSPVWIDRIVQMTQVNVDERGTQAAAFAQVDYPQGGPKFEMVVDRPFFYAIRDNKTGTILFMGIVTDPSKQ